MYDYGYEGYDYGTAANAVGIFAGVGIVMWIIGIAVAVFSVISMWKLFKKAGKKGWPSIIPIYNTIVMIEIAELPMWYLALFLLPLANIYAMFKIYIEIAHKFGKSTGFGIGMVFLNIIFIPMLAFGKAEYKGNNQEMTNNSVVNDSNLPGQFSSNDNFNMQNNVSQFNAIGVNPMNDINMQSNVSMFQPAGNVNNNIYSNDINMMSNMSQNNINDNINNVNNMSFNNNGMMTENVNNLVNNGITSMSEQNVMSNQDMNVLQPVNAVNTNNGMMTENVNNLVNNGITSMPEQNIMSNQGMNVLQPVNVVNANNGMMTENVNNLVNNGVAVIPEQNQMSSISTQISNMKKMCPHCGTQLDFNTMVCSHCGNRL